MERRDSSPGFGLVSTWAPYNIYFCALPSPQPGHRRVFPLIPVSEQQGSYRVRRENSAMRTERRLDGKSDLKERKSRYSTFLEITKSLPSRNFVIKMEVQSHIPEQRY